MWFGLCKSDCSMVGVRKKDWRTPTTLQVKENYNHILSFTDEIHKRTQLDRNKKRKRGRPQKRTRSSSRLNSSLHL
jgi:hypothetical protein